MQIVTVIPISKGISKDTLTYFTSKDVKAGSIVSIPLRKKTVFGLVVESKDAQDMKSEIKTLSYSIKKIENIETHTFLRDAFIESTQKIADYNAGSVGAILSALIPKAILESSSSLSFKQKDPPKGIFHETLLLQSDNEERYTTYKSLIREEFAKNHSVFFCLPTTEDLLNARSTLEKGIEKYTYTLHSGLPTKQIVELWKKISEDGHPVLIISTGSFLSLPRNDLGTIILEKESSRAYKMQVRPFIDIRTVAEMVAKQLNIKLVLGDTLLRIETLWEVRNDENLLRNPSYSELLPLKFRSLTTASCELVNMKGPQDMKKKEFTIFSENLKRIIQESRKNNENTFLFCGRKGLYPVTLCSDCGTVVVCKNCASPVVLYGRKETNTTKTTHGKGNLFVCNHCGERRDAQELCTHCGGWRLNPLGVGIERVAEEIETLFPETKIFIMDKDHVSTHKQAVKVRDLFYATPGSIMLGTEMALTYLNQKVENTSVVSLDSYFSIPDFLINEKIFHILLSMRAITEKNFLIQTRQDNTKIFDYAMKGNLLDFYRDEIADRKSIGYPPFTTYIKISLEGEKTAVKKQMEEIGETLKPFELLVFDAFTPGSRQKFTMHGLVSLQKGKWVDKSLLEKLRQLPQNYMIRIDPVTLL